MFELIYICKIGILAGIIISLVGMILGLAKFTTLNLGAYTGCMLTNRPTGTLNFIAGFAFHIFASAALALVYAFIINLFKIDLTFIHSLIAGCLHTIFSGCLMPQFNRFNPCVKKDALPALGYFASNYGMNGMIAFAITHILYAVIVFWMLRH